VLWPGPELVEGPTATAISWKSAQRIYGHHRLGSSQLRHRQNLRYHSR
jgi:hypothetical protein